MTPRVYSSATIRDLEFLRFFPSLREFSADTLWNLESLDGLRHLPESLRGPRSRGNEAPARPPRARAPFLPRVGRLRYLELWRIRGLSDVSAVGSLPHLRLLFLQTLPHVTALPDFGEARVLRRIELETMKGIRDLAPIATAPALEELLLDDMPQLQPDDLRPLLGHRTLRAVTPNLGGAKKNAET